MEVCFQTPEELLRTLGERIRKLRIGRMLDQKEVAARAGIALRTLRALETGKGSTTETFLRVLKALDALGGLELLVPEPSISPLEIWRSRYRQRPRQRVRRRREEMP